MGDRSRIRDLDVIRDIGTIRAIAHEQRLALLALLARGRWTCAMLAEKSGFPTNRVHYHLRRLIEHGLVLEVDGTSRRRVTERFYVAAARQFIVDPGLGLSDPGMVAAIDSSLQSMLIDWRRDALLNIDLSALTRRIVVDCARVKQGERVLVVYGRFGTELGEALLVEIEAAGARGIVRPWSLNWLLRTLERYSDDELRAMTFVPEEIMASLDAILLLTTNVPEGAPPTPEQARKLPGMLAAMSRWQREVRRRSIRYVEFSLPFRGEFAGGALAPEEGATMFWNAIMADLDAVGQLGGRLHEALAREPAGRLTGPDRTDLEFEIDPDSIAVRDGVVTPYDVSVGRSTESLPAGLLVALPIAERVNGVFVADYTFWSGVSVRRPLIVIEKGRLARIEGAEHGAFLEEMLAGAKGDARKISLISIGLNPAGHGTTGKAELDACLEGTVTVHFGNNEVHGGDVASTLSLTFPRTGLSLTTGDQEILAGGRFVWARKGATRGGHGRGRIGTYARSGLGPADIRRISDAAVAHLESTRDYRNADLRQRDVARAIGVSTHHLSQSLRRGLGATFLELVNRYRVEDFKRRLAAPGSRNLTLHGIAQESGFASKASFYRVFKRATGVTPAEYQARVAGATREDG